MSIDTFAPDALLALLEPGKIDALDADQAREALIWLQDYQSRKAFQPAKKRSPYRRYRHDPVGYAREVLGVTLTPDQERIALSVRDNRRTAVKACHGLGKTVCAAVLANWKFDCWEQNIVYVTAPSWHQALGLTFKWIKTLRLERSLPGRVLDSGLIEDEDRLWAGKHYIRALNAESGEGFQGEHSAPVFIIIEEGIGVARYIFDACDGLMTDYRARHLMICNPTDESTPAGELCRSGMANVLSMSALDQPNILAQLAGGPPPLPGAVDLLWLHEELQKECEVTDAFDEDAFEFWAPEVIEAALSGVPISPASARVYYRPNGTFQGRVLGIFPTMAAEQCIPRGWLETLPALDAGDHLPEVGCDVAMYGADRTAITIRQGPVVHSQRVLRQMDNLFVTDALREAAAAAARLAGDESKAKQIPIKIDVTGGLGTGPYDLLTSEGYRAVPVNASQKARNVEEYHNKRAEMWFTMRHRAREKRLDLSRLPREQQEALIRELSTPKYKPDASGRKIVEKKEEIKKRLSGASPDLADSLLLAFTEAGNWWEDKDLREWLSSHARAGEAPTGEKQAIEAPDIASWTRWNNP